MPKLSAQPKTLITLIACDILHFTNRHFCPSKNRVPVRCSDGTGCSRLKCDQKDQTLLDKSRVGCLRTTRKSTNDLSVELQENEKPRNLCIVQPSNCTLHLTYNMQTSIVSNLVTRRILTSTWTLDMHHTE